MSREERKKFNHNRKTMRNWREWSLHNPIIVIENGRVRPFCLDDLRYFQPGACPGLRFPGPVPEQLPQRLRFNDEGVAHAS